MRLQVRRHEETKLVNLPEISVQRVPVLLYADDLALVATFARGLQSQLDLLHAYADTWGLTINIDKTKAVHVCEDGHQPELCALEECIGKPSVLFQPRNVICKHDHTLECNHL